MRAYEDCMFITIERRRPKTTKSKSLDQPNDTAVNPDVLSSSLPELEFTDSIVRSKPPLPPPRKPRPLPRSKTMAPTPPRPAPRASRTPKVVLRKLHDRPTSVARYAYITNKCDRFQLASSPLRTALQTF